MRNLILFTGTLFALISNGATQASVTHSRTNAPLVENVNSVIQRSYEEKLRLKREMLNSLKLQQASPEQIKTAEDEITALLSTLKNINEKVEKTSTMFSGKENILQGQHVGLARMPQYNAVGVLHSNDQTQCSATIINETADQKYWIGITAAHCIESEKASQDNRSLTSGLSFCFKPLSSSTPGEKESDACQEGDWIPAVGAVVHAGYFEASERNYSKDMAFFMIPKSAKKINYPLFPTEEERQQLYNRIDQKGLEVIGVGYGKAGNIINELQAQFNKTRSAAGKINFSDFIELEDMGKGFKQGKVNFFKSAYRISVYSTKSAQEIIGMSEFASDLIEIPHPITWKNGKIISEDDNIFSGSGRSGDSGRALFTKNSEGKNIIISVASVGEGIITIAPQNAPENREFFQNFREIPQQELQQCDSGSAICSVYFAGSDSSLLDPDVHKWAFNKVSLLKKSGPTAFTAFSDNDDSSISRSFLTPGQENSPQSSNFDSEQETPYKPDLSSDNKDDGEISAPHDSIDEEYIIQSIFNAQEEASYFTPQVETDAIPHIQQTISEMEQQIKEIKTIYTSATPDPSISIRELLVPDTSASSKLLSINEQIEQINILLKNESISTPSLKDKVFSLLPTQPLIPQSLILSLKDLQKELQTLPAYLSGNIKEAGDLQSELDYFNANITYLNDILQYLTWGDKDTIESLELYQQNLIQTDEYLKSIKNG